MINKYYNVINIIICICLEERMRVVKLIQTNYFWWKCNKVAREKNFYESFVVQLKPSIFRSEWSWSNVSHQPDVCSVETLGERKEKIKTISACPMEGRALICFCSFRRNQGAGTGLDIIIIGLRARRKGVKFPLCRDSKSSFELQEICVILCQIYAVEKLICLSVCFAVFLYISISMWNVRF